MIIAGTIGLVEEKEQCSDIALERIIICSTLLRTIYVRVVFIWYMGCLRNKITMYYTREMQRKEKNR